MKIILTVDRAEGGAIILKTKNGDTIHWPKNKLPENTKEGDVLNFEINKDEEGKKEKQNIAKDILNEILDTEE